MMIIIGEPGLRPRYQGSGMSEQEIRLNTRDGEVCLVVDTFPEFDFRISPDGDDLVEIIDKDLEEHRVIRVFDAQKFGYDREGLGVQTKWGVLQTDQASQARLSSQVSVALAAKLLNQPFAVQWRMADNSYADLDADGLLGLSQALAAFVNAVHLRRHAILASLASATSVAALDAIDITSGYPK